VYDNDNLQHTVRFSNSVKFSSIDYAGFKFGGKYAFSTFTDGHLNGVSKSNIGSDPKWNQVNAIARYSLSKRTEVYGEAMWQRAIGHNNVAVMYNAGGFSATSNQVMAAIGMLTRF
jgi:general bacterial porin, GBP family